VLQGVRGGRPADLKALTDLLLKVSRMGEENPEIAEMDLNPVIVYEEGLSVVDARVLLHHKTPPA
jgi:acyl-CoA synthetase (NDP forming)